MKKEKIQSRVGLLILGLAGLAFLDFFIDRLLFLHFPLLQIFGESSLYVLVFSIAFFSVCTFTKTDAARLCMALGVLGISGFEVYDNGSTDYFGPGIAVIGILLLQRFGFLQKHFVLKCVLILLWLTPWVILRDQVKTHVSVAVSLNTILFLSVNVVMLYILFEEEIRDLLATNKSKDRALAEQAAEIARLEPLSVLGERVAHVVHSFRNNLNQVGTALFMLEALHSEERAAEKLREFSKNITERIDNILMISRAGVDLEPEVFDVARLFEGLQQVYLSEPSFADHAKTELTLNGPAWVKAVRWDFILMIENILKNAVEAITARGIRGTIRIDLDGHRLTLANNGGAIETCVQCHDSCLKCPKYGRPGQTTKKGVSGHGLSQVLGTCRKNGWDFRIRTHEDWTLFEIGLKAP